MSSARGLLWLALLALLPVHAARADEPVSALGYWKSVHEDTGKTRSVYRLWEDKGKLVGKILKRFPAPGEQLAATCTECSGAQKGQPIDGLLFVWGLQRDKQNPRKWIDGKILDARDGKTYNCEIEVSPDGKVLRVYGYVRLVMKVGGTREWQRPNADDMRESNVTR